MTELKIHLAQLNTAVGDLEGNLNKILHEFENAKKQNCDLAIFCEMTLTGYPAEDLWLKKYFLEKTNEKLIEIIAATKGSKCAILVGAPYVAMNRAKKEIVYNAAFFIEDGIVKKIIKKKSLPNYGVFDEKRYFEAENILSFVEFRGQTLAILVCEDLWDSKNLYLLQEQIFDCVIAINSSPYEINKNKLRKQMAQRFTKTLSKPLIYLNQVGAQDSLVFDGSSFVIDEKGEEALLLKDFEEDSVNFVLKKGFITKNNINKTQNNDSEINRCNYLACVLGLRDYIVKNGFQKVLLGMSGGIDSALVATIAADALGKENVELYALPSRYNSEQSMLDAQECAKNLAQELKIISIENIFNTMLETLENQEISAIAKENMQSRIRGNILMSLSNSTNALLLSTGNKSEMATGYATLYGDMCGAFNPIKDLYKTQIYELVNWRNQNIPEISFYKKSNIIPQNIITKEPTAELRENQKDSDSLPNYNLLDKILFALIEEQKSVSEIINLGFDKNVVIKIAQLFYNSEYKRRQAVIGTKISNLSFDKDRRYPITNKFKI